MKTTYHTNQTYKFATLQQLVDEVPAERIQECMAELGELFYATKAMADLAHISVQYAAKQEGKTIPPTPKQVIKLPEFIEWIDDGKGDVSAILKTEDGVDLGTIKIK